jgi:hypothetical protein
VHMLRVCCCTSTLSSMSSVSELFHTTSLQTLEESLEAAYQAVSAAPRARAPQLSRSPTRSTFCAPPIATVSRFTIAAQRSRLCRRRACA